MANFRANTGLIDKGEERAIYAPLLIDRGRKSGLVQLFKKIVWRFHVTGYQSLDATQRALMVQASRRATEELKRSGQYDSEVEAREEIRQRVLAA